MAAHYRCGRLEDIFEVSVLLTKDLQPLVNILSESTYSQVAWQNFTQSLVDKFNLHVCHILIINRETKSIRFHIDAGVRIPPEVANEYVKKHVHGDHLIQSIVTGTAEHFHTISRHPNKAQIHDSPHFKEWVMPQGILESAGAKIPDENGWVGLILCNRHESFGDFTDFELTELNSILPHLQDAAKAAFSEQSTSAENRLNAIVNTFRIPVAILNELGRICAINQEMTQLIAVEESLNIDSHCLRIKDKALDNLMYTSLMQTVKRVEGYEFFDNKSEQVAVSPQVFLGFQPLISQNLNGNDQFDGAMVYAVAPNLIKPVTSRKIMELFGLTQKESLICQQLAMGVPAKKVAHLEGISANTVKFHLKNIYMKTGCSNQMSLVNMINSIPYFR